VKKFIALLLIVVLQVIGNVCLSYGMQQVGAIKISNIWTLLTVGIQIITNPWIIGGVACLAAFFILFLVTLSHLDLSYVLPINASQYVLTALFAWLILGEIISPNRWIGIFLVTVGILIVSQSDRN
jgi:transporter family protein